MLDYRAHLTALDASRHSLLTSSFSGTQQSARVQTLTDLAQAYPYAQLGALVDHVFVHAASDGTEIAILGQAASLWKRALAIYNSLGKVRADVEKALDNPSDPSSAPLFNSAGYTAQVLAVRVKEIQSDIVALKNQINPMPHLPPHPRQQDKPAKSWDWGNFMLARRTDAFVRVVHEIADTPATRSFAFGVLASYGANATGSSYLGNVVGGPRRAHRYRDRIGRNAIGSHVAALYPANASTQKIADALSGGTTGQSALPVEISALLHKALKETFDLAQHVPVPDLDQGYRRLLKHLALLDQFVKPPQPAMPSGSFPAKLYGDPTNPPPSLRPQDVVGIGGSGGGSGSGLNSPGSPDPGSDDSKNSSGSICLAILALLVIAALLLLGSFIACCVKWGEGKHCNVFDEFAGAIETIAGGGSSSAQPANPEDPGMTTQGLQAFAATPQATQLVGYMFDLHNQIWEALDQGYNYLAITGMIYPDGLLAEPRFAQFLAIPAAGSWPHRPMTDAADTYHLPPTSPIEHPVHAASSYPAGAAPPAFLTGMAGAALPTAPALALNLWKQIGPGDKDSTNLDLDADRGFNAQCWNVTGSINDDPLGIDVLAYSQQ